jgi:hypothetical protein
MKEIDVCYLVSHGFSSRMVFQTGLLEKLVQKGKRAAVIAPDRNDPNLVDYCSKQGVELYEFRATKNIFTVDYVFMRTYFLEDIRNNPGLWAKHQREIKGNKSWNPYIRLRPYAYYLIYLLMKVVPGLRKRFKAYEDRLLDSPKALSLLEEMNPKLVVATYPMNLAESIVLRAAQKKGIPTALHLLSWDNITCKGHFPALADYYVAWGPVMRDEFMEYYNIPEEKIYPCGVPHFDAHYHVKQQPDYKGFVEELELNPDAPYLFVAMSSPYFAPMGMDIVEWLAQRVNEDVFGPDMQLIVRPHPQNVQGGMADFSWLSRLEDIKGPRVAVDYPSLVESKLPWSMQDHDMNRLSNLLAGCTVCLNYGSTVSIDALMVGKPALVVAFDGDDYLPWWQSGRRQMDYVHYAKLVELGGVRVAWNYEETEEHLRYWIENPDGDLESRNHALSMECGKNDGKATERVANALTEILELNQEQLINQL